jgi:hypothetical protein
MYGSAATLAADVIDQARIDNIDFEDDSPAL